MSGLTAMTSALRARLVLLCSLLFAVITLGAQSPGPQPLPMPAPVLAPADRPYPGTIRLSVDATDTTHHVFRVRETIPLRDSAPLVLLYPQWLPGNHRPAGRVDFLGGLTIRANGRRIEWIRDPVDVFAFRVTPPAGATTLDVTFDFASPVDTAQ